MKKLALFLLLSVQFLHAQDPLLTNTTWYLSSLQTGGNEFTPPIDLTAPNVPLYFLPQGEGLQLMTSHCNTAMTGTVVFTGTESFSYDFCTATLGMCANLANTGFDGLYMTFFLGNINQPMAYTITGAGDASSLVITAPSGDKATYGSTVARVLVPTRPKFAVSPNPTQGLLRLQMENRTAGNLSIVNALGQEVWSSSYETIPESIDISAIGAGLYTLQITADGQTQNTKIVKL